MLVIEDTTPRAQAEVIDYLSKLEVQSSRAGGTREELGVLVKSPDPRERYLFREKFNLAFQLQEHWAYWAGANPGHVERYNTNMQTWVDEETGEMPGSAYGDRMRNTAGHDQIARAIETLREDPDDRRQIIAVHQPAVERYDSNDVACTAYIHPLLRDGVLNMVATVRSQDMYWGYPYDAANLQWIQETMAGLLDVELGEYWHFMDSCHYYVDFEEQVEAVAADGVPVSAPDCRLPDEDFGDAWHMLTHGLEVARGGDVPDIELEALDGTSGFHRDWLGLVTAYEMQRFHDRPETAEIVASAHIENGAWRGWVLDRVAR